MFSFGDLDYAWITFFSSVNFPGLHCFLFCLAMYKNVSILYLKSLLQLQIKKSVKLLSALKT